VRRIAVIGPGGAGKTLVSRELGRRLGLPVVHLDRVFWRAGWVAPDRDAWVRAHREALAAEAWIADGNFDSTLAERLVWADTVVLLDPPPLLCLWRVVWRSVRWRGRRRPDLPSDCYEGPNVAFWTYVLRYRKTQLPGVLQQLRRVGPEKRVVILRSRPDVRRFLAGVGQASPSP
jgi:adenylate kinase family enzyme